MMAVRLGYRCRVIAIEVIALLIAVVVIARSRPPARRTSPRVMSALAGVALLSFAVAIAAISIVVSDRVFAAAIGIAGIAGCAFLWLARGWADDDADDDGDEPLPPDPADGGDALRYRSKRTGGARTPSPRP